MDNTVASSAALTQPAFPTEVGLIIARMAAAQANFAVASVCSRWYRETRAILRDIRISRKVHKETIYRMFDDMLYVHGRANVGAVSAGNFTVYTTMCRVRCRDCRDRGRGGRHRQQHGDPTRVIVLVEALPWRERIVYYTLRHTAWGFGAPVLYGHFGQRNAPDPAAAEAALRWILGPINITVLRCHVNM